MTMPNHTVSVLAALWFCFGRHVFCDYLRPDCDNGKLLVERDLPADAIYWSCPAPAAWLNSTQRFSSVTTVYDLELPRPVCINEPISYHHSIPNSGAFRPVGVQSGEYLYCPPQRWLNNLHQGAAILLYHPCAAFSERPLVSILARSCLLDYIITPHPQLNKSMPVALVSWGRTLELSTAASSDVCHWLQSTTTSSSHISGNYNFLLTRATEQHEHTRREGRHAKTKETVRQCCEQIISSWIKGGIEAEKGPTPRTRNRQGQSRQERAAIPPNDDIKTNGTSQVSHVLTYLKNSDTHEARIHSPVDATLTNLSDPRKTESQNQDLSSRSATQLRSKVSGTIQKKMVLLKVPETDRRRPAAKHSSTAEGQALENEVVDLKARELAQESDTKGQDESAPPKHTHPGRGTDTDNCDTCAAGQQCDCVKDSEGRATLVSGGLARTRRSNDAVWAAGALGFLLVLLTLSILHTRLYRHWRTMPSLYWHDPQQDYDSVADVIQRRLQIAKRRRKRGRRQECALLPSSSSSEEYM
ncbi:tumor protein p53-inducible protein 13 [Syngnathus typhle]|uniref:tumor protein p53-inducible protein 13 n=1 Tax=Syngnathus typhle TaxID=161592 RepID=UPI002A6A51D7|nr:tumor protein p53-inducible protein 13 [Syngnathus typhle]